MVYSNGGDEMNEKSVDEYEPWLHWAMELQAIAQNGLTYASDAFDVERYSRVREIAAEMIAKKADVPVGTVSGLFAAEAGYQTPKLDTRAAVFSDGRILLVRERGRWALPGGWVDAMESVYSNAVKEVREEAGLTVRPLRLIALQDRNKHNAPRYAVNICKVFVLCERIGGEFEANSETEASGFFSMDELPQLAEEKTNAEQIRLCFEAKDDEGWQVQFD